MRLQNWDIQQHFFSFNRSVVEGGCSLESRRAHLPNSRSFRFAHFQMAALRCSKKKTLTSTGKNGYQVLSVELVERRAVTRGDIIRGYSLSALAAGVIAVEAYLEIQSSPLSSFNSSFPFSDGIWRWQRKILFSIYFYLILTYRSVSEVVSEQLLRVSTR